MVTHREEQVRQKAAEYALKATDLSNQIEKFENFLLSLEGKMEVYVDTEFEPIGLARHKGEWRFVIKALYEHNDGQTFYRTEAIAESDLDTKILAAKASKDLIDRIELLHTDVVKNLDSALHTIDHALNFAEKEG